MRGVVAKGARRELRRAMGDQAIDVVQAHTETLIRHGQALVETRQQAEQQYRWLRQELEQMKARPDPRTWVERLRWLMTGK